MLEQLGRQMSKAMMRGEVEDAFDLLYGPYDVDPLGGFRHLVSWPAPREYTGKRLGGLRPYGMDLAETYGNVPRTEEAPRSHPTHSDAS